MILELSEIQGLHTGWRATKAEKGVGEMFMS